MFSWWLKIWPLFQKETIFADRMLPPLYLKPFKLVTTLNSKHVLHAETISSLWELPKWEGRQMFPCKGYFSCPLMTSSMQAFAPLFKNNKMVSNNTTALKTLLKIVLWFFWLWPGKYMKKNEDKLKTFFFFFLSNYKCYIYYWEPWA